MEIALENREGEMVVMNKLYQWVLCDKRKIDMDRLGVTYDEACLTSGYVVAEDISDAKKKLEVSFPKLNNGNYILNFDLGESFIAPYHVQDNRHSDVFLDECLLKD